MFLKCVLWFSEQFLQSSASLLDLIQQRQSREKTEWRLVAPVTSVCLVGNAKDFLKYSQQTYKVESLDYLWQSDRRKKNS